MRKPAFSTKSKGADQLHSNQAADQRLFPHTDSTIPLLPKYKILASSHLLCLYSPQGSIQFYIIPYPIPIYSKTDKGAIGSNTCHLPEAVTSVSHVRMTNNLHHFVQK